MFILHLLELKKIPSPHAEKYSTHQGPDSGNKVRQHYQKEEPLKEPASYNMVEMYYDRQPFVSNGHFTPNPANESLRNSGHYEKVIRTKQSKNDRSGVSNDPIQFSGKALPRTTHKLHTPSRNGTHSSVGAEKNTQYYLYRDSKVEKDDEKDIDKESFVSPADFRGQEFDVEAQPSQNKV